MNILKNFLHVIKDNQIFIEKINMVSKEYAHIPRDELVEVVHNMHNPQRPSITI